MPAPALLLLSILASAPPMAGSLPQRELRPGLVFVQAPETDRRPALWIQQTETTRAAWRNVMGTEPWKHHETRPQPGEDLPVAFVSWLDIQAYLQRLNAQDHDFVYRLPTESEWMEACLGGAGADPQDLDAVAWYDQNAFLTREKFTHPVARKAPNGWGLHDMLGNVWEWIQDGRQGQERLLKGGSWRTSRAVTRASEQNWLEADQFAGDLGFRLVATPVDDGLWSEWKPLQAGACNVIWRVRWIASEGKAAASWRLNLQNQGDAAVSVRFHWGLPEDMPQVEATLEPSRNHEFQATLRRTGKGQRPAVVCDACQTADPAP